MNILDILSADANGQFMAYSKQYLTELCARHAVLFTKEVPEDFLIHHLKASFAKTVEWWEVQDMVPAPETVAGYYVEIIKT